MQKSFSNSELNQSEADETHPNFLTGLLNSYLKSWGERRQMNEPQGGFERQSVAAGAPKRFRLDSDGLAEA